MTTILPFEEEITIEELEGRLLITLGDPNDGEGYQINIGHKRAMEIAQVLANWSRKQQTIQDNVLL